MDGAISQVDDGDREGVHKSAGVRAESPRSIGLVAESESEVRPRHSSDSDRVVTKWQKQSTSPASRSRAAQHLRPGRPIAAPRAVSHGRAGALKRGRTPAAPTIGVSGSTGTPYGPKAGSKCGLPIRAVRSIEIAVGSIGSHSGCSCRSAQ